MACFGDALWNISIDRLGDTVTDVGGAGHHAP